MFVLHIDSKDSRTVDRSLLVSPAEIVPFCVSRKVSVIGLLSCSLFLFLQETKKRAKEEKYNGMQTDDTIIEQESMLKT